jgi:hypothetical protein
LKESRLAQASVVCLIDAHETVRRSKPPPAHPFLTQCQRPRTHLLPRFPERSGPPPCNQERSGAETAARKGPRECPGSETATRAGRRAYTPRNHPCQCCSQLQKDPSLPAFPGGLRCTAEHRPLKDDIAPGKPQDPFFWAGK